MAGIARATAAASSEPDLADLLRCPLTGARLQRDGGGYTSEAEPALHLPVEDGILRAFLPHDRASADVTADMQRFYEAHPFPDYEDVDDVGVLIQRSVERGFPELLNRAIPLHATVLEVGCGTGQLGCFLSIPGRRVLSVDLCLHSLRLAQAFKQANGLGGVSFAQMNLFRLPLQPERFDVVICSGVLHHTADPRGGFLGLLPLVRPGGHIVVGLYNRFGRLKTRVRQRLGRWLGDGALAALDPYLRERHLQARKRRAWISDQYRNPHESLHTLDQVLGWFDAAGVEFVRSLPPTRFGSLLELDYRRSLFDPEPRASRADRLLSQLEQGLRDREGGLFVVIGVKR
jgi:SAM-dependent methyltransferase